MCLPDKLRMECWKFAHRTLSPVIFDHVESLEGKLNATYAAHHILTRYIHVPYLAQAKQVLYLNRDHTPSAIIAIENKHNL